MLLGEDWYTAVPWTQCGMRGWGWVGGGGWGVGAAVGGGICSSCLEEYRLCLTNACAHIWKFSKTQASLFNTRKSSCGCFQVTVPFSFALWKHTVSWRHCLNAKFARKYRSWVIQWHQLHLFSEQINVRRTIYTIMSCLLVYLNNAFPAP